MNQKCITKLDLEKARNQRSNCQHVLDHRKSKRGPEKHLILLYWGCQSLWLCGSQQTVENSSRHGNTRSLVCLLRNLCAGEEATDRNGHGTTDRFQIGKGVYQDCVVSPGLFNLYAEYVRINTGWMKHRLESRLPGEISITSDMQVTPPLWQKVKWSEVKSLSHVRLFATPWTVAYQAPQSMRFSRQEYWSGLPFPSPGDPPDPGSNPGLPHSRQML